MINRTTDAPALSMAPNFDNVPAIPGPFANDGHRRGRFAPALAAFLALGLFVAPTASRADGGAAGTASAVIAGVSLVSSWINGQNDNAAAAGYAAQWGSDCSLIEDSTTDTGFYVASAQAEVDDHCGWAHGRGYGSEGLLGYWSQGTVSGNAYAVAKYAYEGQSHNVYAWGKGSVDGKSKGKGKGSPGVGPRQGSIQPPNSPHTVVARFDPFAGFAPGTPTPLLGAGLGVGTGTILPQPDWARMGLVNGILNDIGAAPGEVYAILLLDEVDLNASTLSGAASSWTGRYFIEGAQVAQVSAGIDAAGTPTIEGLSDSQYSTDFDPSSGAHTLTVPGPIVVGIHYLGTVATAPDSSDPKSITVELKVEGDAEAEDAAESSGSTHTQPDDEISGTHAGPQ